MIAKITTGKSFRGTLDYLMNEKKNQAKKESEKNQQVTEEKFAPEFGREVETESAAPYGEGKRHRIIGGNMSGQTPTELAREFDAIREQRPDISTPVHHVSISAKEGEKITIEQWQKIAAKYTDLMGFSNSAYVVVQHRDAERNDQLRDHIHILTSRVDVAGKVVSEWQSKRRAEDVLREVEIEYDLVRVPSSQETIRAAPTRGEMERFNRTGDLSVKMRLQGHIDCALENRPTATEFIEKLNRVGVEVIPNLQSTDRMSGISFRLENELMKGSNLGRGYSWQGLQKRALEYDPARDLPALQEAHRRASVERSDERSFVPPAELSSIEAPQQPGELAERHRFETNPLAQFENPMQVYQQVGQAIVDGYSQQLQRAAGLEPGRDSFEVIEQLNRAAGVRHAEPSLEQFHPQGESLTRAEEQPLTSAVEPVAAHEAEEQAIENDFDLSL